MAEPVRDKIFALLDGADALHRRLALVRLGVHAELGPQGTLWAVMTVLAEQQARPPRTPLLADLVAGEAVDSLADAALRAGLVLGLASLLVVLTLGGMSDLIARALEVLVERVIVFFRAAVFVAPVTAGAATVRLARSRPAARRR